MPEEPLFERLRRELEAPPLAAPSPSQARYTGTSAAGPGRRWLKLGGAFAAGAIATGLVITAGTGSPDPQVWTIRVASALSQLGEPHPETSPTAPPAASPSPTPVLAPTPGRVESSEPAEPASPEAASPGETGEGSGDRSGSGPAVEPSATPEAGGGGSDGGGSTDGAGGTDGGGTDGGSSSTPNPSPSPEGDH